MGLIRNIRKGFVFLRRNPGLGPDELALIRHYLSLGERELFFAMDEPDQWHSVRVARICAQSLQHHPQVAAEPMMRAALLHDIGKAGAGLGLWFRTFWVLGHRVIPWVLDWIADRSENAAPGSLRRRMYVQRYHAQMGARMLEQVGTEEAVLRIVLYTEEKRRAEDCLEKRILMAADADRVVREVPSPRSSGPS